MGAAFEARTRYPGSHLRAGMPWGREWTAFVFEEKAEKSTDGAPRVINAAGMAALKGDARIEVREVKPAPAAKPEGEPKAPSGEQKPDGGEAKKEGGEPPAPAPQQPPAQPKKGAGRR